MVGQHKVGSANTLTMLSIAFFGRLDGNGHFRTAMTQMSPNIKNTYPLHPSVSDRHPPGECILNVAQQKRILTVRECARVQGFPDYYQMQSMNNTTSKIVNDVSINHGSLCLNLTFACSNIGK